MNLVDGMLVLAIVLGSFALSSISLSGRSVLVPVLFFLLVGFIVLYPDDEATKKGLVFVLLTSLLSALIVKETCCSDKVWQLFFFLSVISNL